MIKKLDGKHNRACPKCGSSVVAVSFEDVDPMKESPYCKLGVACANSDCDWEIQFRSANA